MDEIESFNLVILTIGGLRHRGENWMEEWRKTIKWFKSLFAKLWALCPPKLFRMAVVFNNCAYVSRYLFQQHIPAY